MVKAVLFSRQMVNFWLLFLRLLRRLEPHRVNLGDNNPLLALSALQSLLSNLDPLDPQDFKALKISMFTKAQLRANCCFLSKRDPNWETLCAACHHKAQLCSSAGPRRAACASRYSALLMLKNSDCGLTASCSTASGVAANFKEKGVHGEIYEAIKRRLWTRQVFIFIQ